MSGISSSISDALYRNMISFTLSTVRVLDSQCFTMLTNGDFLRLIGTETPVSVPFIKSKGGFHYVFEAESEDHIEGRNEYVFFYKDVY